MKLKAEISLYVSHGRQNAWETTSCKRKGSNWNSSSKNFRLSCVFQLQQKVSMFICAIHFCQGYFYNGIYFQGNNPFYLLKMWIFFVESQQFCSEREKKFWGKKQQAITCDLILLTQAINWLFPDFIKPKILFSAAD